MCGRLAQTRSVRTYSDSLGMPVRDDFEDLDNPTGNFNAGPGLANWVIRCAEDASVLKAHFFGNLPICTLKQVVI